MGAGVQGRHTNRIAFWIRRAADGSGVAGQYCHPDRRGETAMGLGGSESDQFRRSYRAPALSLSRGLVFVVVISRIPKLERVMGIEPTWPAWKAGTLPLSYTRSRVLR